MLARKMILGAALLLCIVFVVPSLATTYYVKPDGSDSSDGLSWATAFATIQKGINATANSDVVDVNKGTYYEGVSFSGKNITVCSTDPNNWDVVEATVIDGNGATNTVLAHASLSGFTVTGGNCGIYCTSGGPASPAVSKCVIRNNSDKGIYVTGCGAIIKNCIIKNNSGDGIYVYYANITAVNNIIYDNNEGIYSQYASGTMRNNTIVDNTSYGIRYGMYGNPTISNCILWNNNDDLNNCTATYSCIQDGDAGTGNISSDPCFVNANVNDYRLLYGSPCIDRSNPSTSSAQIGLYDLLQNNRFIDGDGDGVVVADMGCFEYFDLSAMWNLNDGSGSTAQDNSGNSHTGTLYGPSWYFPGQQGKCLSFDGNDDYVQVGATDSAPIIPEGSKFTISAWFNPDSNSEHYAVYGYYSGNSDQNLAYLLETDAGDILFKIGNGSAIQEINNICNGEYLRPGEWYHVAITYDGSNMAAYVNGDFSKSVAVTLSGVIPSAGTGTKKELIGAAYAGADLNFDGLVDTVTIWQRALSSEEIAALYVKDVIDVKKPPYNAVADGNTDDSNAIQRAINDANSEGKTILLENGIFAVNSMIDLKTNTQLIGKSATIKNIDRSESGTSHKPLLNVFSDCVVKGLILDGNNKALNGIEVATKNNVVIEDCVIKNLSRSGESVYGIWLICDCSNILIRSCQFKDINTVAGSGAVEASRGIMVSAGTSTMNDIIISGCKFNGIYASEPNFDGDAIHVFSHNYDLDNDSNQYYWLPVDVTISDCCFSNFAKRAIKLQCSNATVTNCHIDNDNCKSAYSNAISVFGSSTTITGNIIYLLGEDPNMAWGLYASCANDLVVRDNIIILNPANHFWGTSAVYMDRGSHHNNITDNQIRGSRCGLIMTDFDPNDKFGFPHDNNFINNVVDVWEAYTYLSPADPCNQNNNMLTPNILPWSMVFKHYL